MELYLSVKQNKLEKVEEILVRKKGSQVLEYKDKHQRTCFFICCKTGNLDILRRLLKESVDVNSEDEYGWTPIYAACFNNHVEVVHLLLQDSRLNLQAGKLNCWALLFQACRFNNHEMARLLLEDERTDVNKSQLNDWSPFYVACLYGHMAIVQLLLSHPLVDVNQVDRYGWSPLSVACFYNNIEVVNLLLPCTKVDLDLASFKDFGDDFPAGVTPIDIARIKGNNQVLFALEKEIQKRKISFRDSRILSQPLIVNYQEGHIKELNVC